MALFCGIDWATDHHDVAVVDDDGRVVARGRVGNDAAGFAQLLMLLAEAGDTATQPMPVGIETDRGLWVAALRETGRVLYPINPLAASRYRARYGVSGPNRMPPMRCCWLTSCAPMPARIGRCQPTPAWRRPSGCWPELSKTRCGRANRSATKSVICWATSIRPPLSPLPSCPAGFGPRRCPGHPGRRTDSYAGRQAEPARLRKLLIKAGRRRDLDRDVERLRQIFTDTYLHQPPVVENAMGIQLDALLRQFDAACAAADELAEAASAHFELHPDAAIITSFPGLGNLTGARVLAEIGDDRSRFADARGLKAFAGSARSPAPAARKPWCCIGISKTGAWPLWVRSGRWRRCAARLVHVATSMPAARPETGTAKPNGTCSTSFSASFITACKPANSTTNTGRFHLLSRMRLDFQLPEMSLADVCRAEAIPPNRSRRPR
ncbi:transposase IS116/IS110/IS902 family protein [Mycobacterium xenopi 3993]|nr:transposase IS116/IS110/IS902 family protein [Mycobacterium xenopi 3993]